LLHFSVVSRNITSSPNANYNFTVATLEGGTNYTVIVTARIGAQATEVYRRTFLLRKF